MDNDAGITEDVAHDLAIQVRVDAECPGISNASAAFFRAEDGADCRSVVQGAVVPKARSGIVLIDDTCVRLRCVGQEQRVLDLEIAVDVVALDVFVNVVDTAHDKLPELFRPLDSPAPNQVAQLHFGVRRDEA